MVQHNQDILLSQVLTAFAKWPPSIWEQSDENRRLTRSSSETTFFGALLCTAALPLALVVVVVVVLALVPPAVVDGGGIFWMSERERVNTAVISAGSIPTLLVTNLQHSETKNLCRLKSTCFGLNFC